MHPSYSIHFNRHPHCIFAASCRVALSISTDGHVLDRLLSRRFTCGVWTPSNTFPWAHLAPTSRPVHVAHRDSAANRALHSSRSRQRVTSPSKLTFTWGSEAPSNTWFLGPTRVHNPNGNGHLDRFCRFSRPDDRDRPTDILTDRQTYDNVYGAVLMTIVTARVHPVCHVTRSVAIRHIYVVLRCGLKS